jgi:hypothetical protein
MVLYGADWMRLELMFGQGLLMDSRHRAKGTESRASNLQVQMGIIATTKCTMV